MTIMKSLFRSTLVLLCSASLAPAATTLINLDLNYNGSSTYSGAGALGTAGDQWTAINRTTSGGIAATSLKYSDGTASGITFSLSNSHGVFNAGTAGALLQDFVYLHTSSSNTATITLSGFTANQSLASIVLYGMNGDAGGTNPNQNASFTIGGVTKSTNATSVTSTLAENVNYVRFDNIQANGSGNVVITWTNPAGGSNWSTFNGLQIQAVPEPSAALLGSLGLLALLRRRR